MKTNQTKRFWDVMDNKHSIVVMNYRHFMILKGHEHFPEFYRSALVRYIDSDDVKISDYDNGFVVKKYFPHALDDAFKHLPTQVWHFEINE